MALASEISADGLLGRIEAVRSCTGNPYAPATVWWPVFGQRYMELDLREQVSQQIFLHGCTEVDLLDFFVWTIDEGMTFLDIGAHIGFFSIVASDLVGPTGSVHSFEPTPGTVGRLELNLRNAEATNVRVHSKALWNEEAELQFKDFGPELSAYNSLIGLRIDGQEDRIPAAVHKVQATTLDAICSAFRIKPDVVKLDVESAEFQVLQGGHEVLVSSRPIIAIEVGDFGGKLAGARDSATSLKYLMSYSYELFEIRHGEMVPHLLSQSAYAYSNIIGIPAEKIEAVRKKAIAR